MVELSGHSVLVIDDDPDSVSLLETLCMFHKVNTLTFTSPAAALDAILNGLSETPSAVFLDLDMKGTSGYQLQGALRKHLTCPIIVYTSLIDEIGTVKAAGFDGFIGKP